MSVLIVRVQLTFFCLLLFWVGCCTDSSTCFFVDGSVWQPIRWKGERKQEVHQRNTTTTTHHWLNWLGLTRRSGHRNTHRDPWRWAINLLIVCYVWCTVRHFEIISIQFFFLVCIIYYIQSRTRLPLSCLLGNAYLVEFSLVLLSLLLSDRNNEHFVCVCMYPCMYVYLLNCT